MTKLSLLFASLFLASITIAQSDVSKAFSESYKYEYNSNNSAAITAMEKVNSAGSYEINLRLGWLYYLTGNFTKSQNFYSNAIKSNPNSIEAKLGYALPTGELGDWNSIIETYNSILKLDPNNYVVNLRMANIYYNRNDFEKAKSFGESIIGKYPFDYSLNLILGKTYFKLGKITNAKTHLKRAVLYNPKSEEATKLLEHL